MPTRSEKSQSSADQQRAYLAAALGISATEIITTKEMLGLFYSGVPMRVAESRFKKLGETSKPGYFKRPEQGRSGTLNWFISAWVERIAANEWRFEAPPHDLIPTGVQEWPAPTTRAAWAALILGWQSRSLEALLDRNAAEKRSEEDFWADYEAAHYSDDDEVIRTKAREALRGEPNEFVLRGFRDAWRVVTEAEKGLRKHVRDEAKTLRLR